jgi:hypothetical protein
MWLQNIFNTRKKKAGLKEVQFRGVKPVIQPIRAKNITKVVPFKEKSSFHFVVL